MVVVACGEDVGALERLREVAEDVEDEEDGDGGAGWAGDVWWGDQLLCLTIGVDGADIQVFMPLMVSYLPFGS